MPRTNTVSALRPTRAAITSAESISKTIQSLAIYFALKDLS